MLLVLVLSKYTGKSRGFTDSCTITLSSVRFAGLSSRGLTGRFPSDDHLAVKFDLCGVDYQQEKQPKLELRAVVSPAP